MLISQRMGTKNASREDLADYVRRIMAEKKLSGRDIEIASRRQIKQAYISQIVNRVITSPSVEKVKALAKALGEPVWDVLAVAIGEEVESLPNYREERLRAILFEAGELDAELQRDVDTGIRLIEAAVRSFKQKAKSRT